MRHLLLPLFLLLAACARPDGATGVSGYGAPGPNGAAGTAGNAVNGPGGTIHERQRPVAPRAKALKVALLLPLTQPGKTGDAAIGAGLERAARLALSDQGAPFEMAVIDTTGTVAGAQEAARRAVRGGARLVIGPVFAANVAAASAVTLPAGVPMLSLSSDAGRATGGVYANAFTPQADVQAVLNHAARLGTRHAVVFAPTGRYGDIVLAEARRTLDANNGQVAYAVRTDGTAEGYMKAARQAAVAAEGADTLYIPQGGRAPRALIGALARAGVDLTGKRILGSGQWLDAELGDSRLNGALFASNDPRAFRAFSHRFEARHATKPAPLEALTYDAVAVAVRLTRRAPGQPFSRAGIESESGFQGATGLFRFRPDGAVERRLAIFRVEGGEAKVTKTPAATFAPASAAPVASYAPVMPTR